MVYGDVTPLSVSFLDLQTQWDEASQSVIIMWHVQNQINNNYFEIMKSEDGINFTTIGSINGIENRFIIKAYSFVDQTSNSLTTNYKIKQVDLDGKEHYSSDVQLQ